MVQFCIRRLRARFADFGEFQFMPIAPSIGFHVICLHVLKYSYVRGGCALSPQNVAEVHSPAIACFPQILAIADLKKIKSR